VDHEGYRKEVFLFLERGEFHFDPANGALYYQPEVAGKFMFVIESWGKGMEVYRQEFLNWVPDENGSDICLIPDGESPSDALRKFCQSIPKDICSSIKPFQYLQLKLLRMIRQGRQCFEFYNQSPVLFWLVAQEAKGSGWRLAEMKLLLAQKRIELIRELFGDRPKEDLKKIDRFLKKIILHRGDFNDMQVIHRAAQSLERVTSLKSLDRIHVSLLTIVDGLPANIMKYALKILPTEKYCGTLELERIKKTWGDTLRLGTALEIPHPQKEIKKCADIDDLLRLHDQWVRKFNKNKEKMMIGKKPFPAPPFKSNRNIRSITSALELYEEGHFMEHCAGVLQEVVYSRTGYFYKVFAPERGTLLLIKMDNEWTIGEFSLAHNQLPSKESWEGVREWLETVKRSPIRSLLDKETFA
jgi:PcfJ-like protein